MASPVTLRARLVVPVVGPALENGYVCVSDGRITEIGRWSHAPNGGATDLGDSVLLPGFVNAHTHLELTGYAGQIPPGDLWSWVGKLLLLRAAPGRDEREREGVRSGAEQSLRAGVTTVGDISRAHLAWPILKASPLRKVCFAELLCFAEEPARTLDELRAKVHETQADERLVAGISPHAPYSVTADQLRGCVDLAALQGLPLTMHVAETIEERQYIEAAAGRLYDWLTLAGYARQNPPPRRPLFEHLAATGLLNSPALLAHVNYLSDAELDQLARSPCSVAYCPRAHRFYGHEPHRFRDMLARGINVCVGTDSLAANESLSIVDELRFLHREHPDVAPPALLEMGTIRGARALRLEAQVGSLEVGKQADLVAIPCASGVGGDAVARVLESPSPPGRVFVAGEAQACGA